MVIAQGATLGSYTIIEQLGRGGMAAVYKAYHARLDRYVAIKVMLPVISQDPGFRERFEQEARAVARFRHTNIVTIHDFGEEQGLAYLVTELIDGGTLAERTGSPLDPGVVVRVVGPIASALDYAHERGVLHRDVKPSNILLRADLTPVLSDFGIAKLSNSSAHMTRTGLVMGTPAYQAPEQASGEPASDATDQYALGIVAYELLTGRVPFSAETPMAVLLAHLVKPLPPPRELNSVLSEEIEQVLLKTLAKRPDDRYPTVSDFATALAEAVAIGGYGPMVPPGPTPSYGAPATPAWLGTPKTPVRPPFLTPPDAAAFKPPVAAEPPVQTPIPPPSARPAVETPRTPASAPSQPAPEAVAEPAPARGDAPPTPPGGAAASGPRSAPAPPLAPPSASETVLEPAAPIGGGPAGEIAAGPATPVAPPPVEHSGGAATVEVQRAAPLDTTLPEELRGAAPPFGDAHEKGREAAPPPPVAGRQSPAVVEPQPRTTPPTSATTEAPPMQPGAPGAREASPAVSPGKPAADPPAVPATVAEPLPKVELPTALEPLPPVAVPEPLAPSPSVGTPSALDANRATTGATTTITPAPRHVQPAGRRLPLPLVGGAVALVLAGALVVLVSTYRPAPAPPAPTVAATIAPIAGAVSTALASAKTAAPTLLATALPTAAPTAVPTAAPVAQPTVAPTATAQPAPTATPNEEQAWQRQEAALNAVWGKDWPQTISQLNAFLKRYPNNTDAKDKLYAALISYGDQLVQAGDKAGAAAQYAAAHQVYLDRPEASAALAALTPTPVPTPTPTPVPQPAQQQQPIQQQPVQQPVQQPIQQKPAPTPVPVHTGPRPGFTPVAERIRLATPTPSN